jgi:hypothetical protein
MGMEAGVATIGRFGEEHFGQCRLGDRRRTKRLVKVANDMVRHPGGTFPDKLNAPADLKAFYRLMHAESVTHASVLAAHRERTLERARAHQGVVLWVHDTTELEYSGLASLKEALGQIGEGHGRGYLCHNSLAVTAEQREVLGLANQILHRRPVVAKGETKEQRRQRKDRESLLWKHGVEPLPAPTPEQRWIDLADRGSDITEFIAFEVKHQRQFVIRSQHNRRIFVEIDGEKRLCKLHDWARSLAAQGQRSLVIQARDGQPERQVELAVSWSALQLIPPRQARGEHGRDPIPLWVVRVWEVNPPPGVQAVEWILLTNVAVMRLDEGWQRVTWYQTRWIIEEYHKAQKTGCSIEEMQFESVERLQPAIALISVIALSLLWLRTVSRGEDAKTRPATEHFALEYVQMLSQWRWRQVRPAMSVHDFCYALARLGGHQNRRRDHLPGWLVLWRGWTKLQLMLEGALAMTEKRSG